MFLRSHRAPRLLLSLAAIAAAWTAPEDAGAQTPASQTFGDKAVPGKQVAPTDQWDTFGVDISIRQWRIVGGASPAAADVSPTVYRFERSKIDGQWRSVITVRSLPELKAWGPNGVGVLERKSVIARIEDDEDHSPVRVYNQRGELLKVPATFPLPFSTAHAAGSPGMPKFERAEPGQVARPRPAQGTEWINAFVAIPDGRLKRRDTLIRRYGPAAGQVRGLDRFIEASGAEVEEVLVDPHSGLEVEVNRVRNGQLVAHRTVAYQPLAGGVLARRASRSERLVGEGTDRTVIDIQFTNLSFERRSQP